MARTPTWRRHERMHGDDPQRDVDDEFTFHLEQRIEAIRQTGKSSEAAEEEAMRRFGDLQGARQAYLALAARRSARQSALAFLHALRADVSYTLRVLRRSPGFAFGVVLVAGLGIGINSALFAGLNAFFMRPLPVPHPDEIVRVYTNESRNNELYGGNSYPDYIDIRQVPALRGLAAYAPLAAHVRTDATLVRAEGRLVSENFFAVLAVPPGVGRMFSPNEAVTSEFVPAVLGHAFWRRHFASDRAIAGRIVEINGVSTMIVGVVGAGFTGVEPSQVDVYLPARARGVIAPDIGLVEDRGARSVRLIGRLAPGVTAARAAEDMNIIMRALARDYPETNAGRIVTAHRASSLVDVAASRAPVMPIMMVLFSVTGVLLLITTVNVAGMLLARTVARRRELALRLSLGASHWRLFRQLVTESLVLALGAEAVALVLLAGLPVVARALAVPETVQFGIDVRILAFASLVTLITALGFSIGPALRGSARNPYEGLRETFASMPLSRARGQRVLVVSQVALSIMLLGTAVLLTQSLRRQYAVDPGFETAHLLVAEYESALGVSSRDEEGEFAREVVTKVRELAGVVAATVTTSAPLTSEGARTTIDIPGFPKAPDEPLEVPFTPVGPDYCAALGLRIQAGEELRSGGGPARGRRAVLVNETMARLYWPDSSPVGFTISRGGTSLPVIGVVGDVRMVALSRPAAPHFYLQSDDEGGPVLLIRTATTADSLGPELQRTFGNSGAFTLRRLRSMEEVMGASLAEAKVFAAVAASISLLALFLAMSALYAVVSYLAAQRTREFGIRLALGATSADVMRLVLTSGLRLSTAGVAIGVIGAFASTTVLQAFVFAVSPADAAMVLGVAAVAGAVAISACAIPALRAAALRPADTLRVD